MAKNLVYPRAEHISVPAPADVKSGEPVVVGTNDAGYAGVAIIDAANGYPVTLDLVGSWSIPVKEKVNAGQRVNVGTDGKLTTGAGRKWGVALEGSAAPGADAHVKPLGAF